MALQPVASGAVAGTVSGGTVPHTPTPTRTATPPSRANYVVLVPLALLPPPPPPPPVYLPPPPPQPPPPAAPMAAPRGGARGDRPPASEAAVAAGSGGEVPVVPEAEGVALLARGLVLTAGAALLQRGRHERR